MYSATGSSDLLEEPFEAGREAAEQVQRKLAVRAADERGAGTDRGVAIVFASARFDLPELIRGIRSVIDLPIFGCTAHASAGDDAARSPDAVSLLVLRGKAIDIGLGLGRDLSQDGAAAVQRAWEMARSGMSAEPRCAIVLPDAALCHMGDVVADELARLAGPFVPVVGACPGDGGKFQRPAQFFGADVVHNAVALLLLGGDVEACVVTRSGWQPLGARGVVTRTRGPRLLEIDGRPAVEFLERTLGRLRDPEVLASFPIGLVDQIVHSGGKDYDVLRAPLFREEIDGAVICGSPLKEGQNIQIGKATREQIFASAFEASARLRRCLAERKPECLLFASSGARMMTLGAQAAREYALIREGFGHAQASAIGFHSYAEIGPFDSEEPALRRPRFHNANLVLCALLSPQAQS